MRSRVFEASDNFDALRLLFASSVAVFHFIVLTGAPSIAFLDAPFRLAADLSVSGFFVLSGYLVLGSFQRSKTLLAYAEKRFRRLYPAYAVIILACTFGALLFSAPARNDLGAVAQYLGANLLFMNFLAPTLPGVFENNPIKAVNGALWTLKIEVAFYCILPLIAVLAVKLRAGKWLLFAGLYLGAELWRAAFHDAGGGFAMLAHQLPGQMSYFVMGMALWDARSFFKPGLVAASFSLALLILTFVTPVLDWARAASLGALLIAIASAPIFVLKTREPEDFSYGIYILHFPIIQVVHAYGEQAPIWMQAAFSSALTLGLAMLLWRFVERPMLHASSHYRKPAPAAEQPR